MYGWGLEVHAGETVTPIYRRTSRGAKHQAGYHVPVEGWTSPSATQVEHTQGFFPDPQPASGPERTENTPPSDDCTSEVTHAFEVHDHTTFSSESPRGRAPRFNREWSGMASTDVKDQWASGRLFLRPEENVDSVSHAAEALSGSDRAGEP